MQQLTKDSSVIHEPTHVQIREIQIGIQMQIDQQLTGCAVAIDQG